MSNVKKLKVKFDYLPLEEPGKKFLPSCTSTYHALPLCKVSSKSIKRYRRSCAYEVHMSNVKKLNFKFDNLPLEEPGKKFLSSCTYTYDALPLCKVSSKSIKQYRRSCAYAVHMSNVKKLNFKFDYLPLEEPGKIFLSSCTYTYDA